MHYTFCEVHARLVALCSSSKIPHLNLLRFAWEVYLHQRGDGGDGTYSFSENRRGTCSHHGGVSRWYQVRDFTSFSVNIRLSKFGPWAVSEILRAQREIWAVM